jgi:hypothetical protein
MEKNEVDRVAARSRGVRAAARIAGLALLIGAGAAYADDRGTERQPLEPADRVVEMASRPTVGGCCALPSWGPPAPPAMRAELWT